MITIQTSSHTKGQCRVFVKRMWFDFELDHSFIHLDVKSENGEDYIISGFVRFKNQVLQKPSVESSSLNI